MAAHRSQIGDESFFLNIPDDLSADVFGVEEFALRAGTPGATDRPESSVFEGLPT